MSLMPSFHSSFPDARAVRTALAAGAVAGLIVIAACNTDVGTSPKALTAPAGPRAASSSSGTEGHGNGFAGLIRVCVDASSPPGTYKFRNSNWNDGIAIAAGSWNGNSWVAGGYDPGDGGEALGPGMHGTTAWLPNQGDNSEYTVAVGSCVDVANRTAPSPHYNGTQTLPASNCTPNQFFDCVIGPDHQDDFQAVNIVSSTIPGTAQYDHTDCILDNGVVDPQPIACSTGNNPTRAFANYDHGTKLTFVFTQAPVLTECTLGYPDNSHLPQSQAAFNESEVLTGFAISGTGGSRVLHAWYTDEHALTLGVDSVFVNNKNSPDQGYHYTFDNMAGHSTGALTAGITGSPVNVGRTNTTTAPIGLANPMDGAGRLLAPGLYLTDLNTNPNPRGGDWQQGGSPVFPSAVYGTWKGAIITIDNTKNPPGQTSLTPRADPAKNHKVVGPGGMNPPTTAIDNGYSSDIQWSLSSLGLTSGHAYRAQVIVHDGDQNKTGGDVGQACINIQN